MAAQSVGEMVRGRQANDEVRVYEVGERVRAVIPNGNSVFGEITGVDQGGNYVLSVQMPDGVIPMTVEPRQLVNEDNIAGVEDGSVVDYYDEEGNVQSGEVTGVHSPERYEGFLYVNGDRIPISNIMGLASVGTSVSGGNMDVNPDELIARMEANAVPAPELELTPENWYAEFGENGMVETPIGEVKMGENQLAKLILNKRGGEFGMIGQTLKSPDVVVEVPSEAKTGQETERASSYLFVKTFVRNGKNVRHFESVTVSRDGLEVVVSNHIIKPAQLMDRLLKGKIFWMRPELNATETSGESQNLDENAILNPNSNSHGSENQNIDPLNKGTEENSENQEGRSNIEVIKKNAPRQKGGEIDWDALLESDPEAFSVLYESEAGAEETVRELSSVSENLSKKIDSAKKKLDNADSINKKVAAKAEIEGLQKRKSGIDGIIQRYGAVSSNEEDNGNTADAETSVPDEDIRSNEDWYNVVSERSVDPVEIVNAYHSAMEDAEYENLLPWQAGLLSYKIHPESFYRFGDRNSAGDVRAWLLPKKESVSALNSIDTIAKELSTEDLEVTPDMIVSFMLDHPWRSVKKGNDYTNRLNRRFRYVASGIAGTTIGGIDSISGRNFMRIYNNINARAGSSAELSGSENEQMSLEETIRQELDRELEDVILEDPGIDEQVGSIGIGAFGNIYDQFRGKAKEAIDFLLQRKEGEALGALSHPEIGEIDLVWGKEGTQQSDGYGLAKIAKFHPEVLDNLQEILNEMRVISKTGNRIQLESDKYSASVRLEWDNVKKTWLLTAFEKKNAASDSRTDIVTEPEGKQIDTATLQNGIFPTNKDREISSEKQEGEGDSSVEEKISDAEAQVEQNPTEAQKEAGNYRKGHVSIQGIDITIDNPKGSVRSGVDENGRTWETEMKNTYGYIKRTKGKDGDQIDVFLGESPDSRTVFVVDQINPNTGAFDEHKVMLGFNTIDEARDAYLSNYEEGWQGLGGITEVSVDNFKAWAGNGTRRIKPFAEYKEVKEDQARYQTDPELEAVNARFNEELQRQIDGSLPQGNVYQLGNPSTILQSAGIPNLPIEMASARLLNKSNQENHPFELSEVENLPQAIHNPLAVFRSATHVGSNVILTELQQGNKNFVVAIETNRRKGNIQVNSIRSIHPRTTSNIVSWINDGLMDYADISRMNDWVADKKKNSRSIFGSTPANAIQQLNSASNVIQNFENPKFQRGNNSFTPISRRLFDRLIDRLKATGLAKDVVTDSEKMRGYLESHIGKENADRFMAYLGKSRTDRSGNEIGDGNYHVEPSIFDFGEYPQITTNISYSNSTESVYVTYRNTENGNSIRVRFSNHDNNAVKFGDELNGFIAKIDEVLFRLGLKTRKFIPKTYLNIQTRQVSKKDLAQGKYEKSDKTIQELYALGKDADISAHTGKIAKDSNYLILGDKVNEYEDKIQDAFGNIRTRGIYVYEDLQMMATPKGDVYGFVTPDGTVYLDPDRMNANTPVHEFGHLWNTLCRESNPDLWNRIVGLCKETPMWKALSGNPAYENLKTDDQKADEVFASLLGNRGEARVLLGELGGDVGLFARVRNVMNDFWMWLKSVFGNTEASVNRMADATLDELLSGKSLSGRGVNLEGDRDRARVQSKTEYAEQSDYDFDVSGITAENAQEMRRIKEAEQANGTFMLAPNGEKSKLNERKWLQVRTGKFKEWFGDWEKATRIEKLRESKPIEITGEEYAGKYELNRDSAKAYIKDHLRDDYKNVDTGEIIKVSRIGANEVTSHGERDLAHLKSIAAIPEIIKNSIFIVEEPNIKESGKYESYRYYVSGLKIGSENYTVKMVIGKKGDSYYYDHELTQIEKGNLIEATRLPNSLDRNEVISRYKDKRLISILQTDSSKVVDENGEPMLMYHGSPSVFNTFNLNSTKNGRAQGEGFYFTSNEKQAKGFGDKLYTVFLNSRNPYNGGRTYYSPEIQSILDNTEGEWSSVVKKAGFDSIGDNYKNVFVVFNPSQIKSATDNNGNFDEESGDIRFMAMGVGGYYLPDTETEFEDRINYISQKTGIKFTKSKNTNSWYGEYDGKKVRISDHFSKFEEKNEGGKDFHFSESDNSIIKRIKGENLFENYKEGDTITHTHKSIGEATFISYNPEKGYVEIKDKDGNIRKIDESRFLFKEQDNIRLQVVGNSTESGQDTEERRKEVDRKIDNLAFRLREAWEDKHLAVKEFLDVLRESGTKVADYNDFYLQATHLAGKNDAQLRQYYKIYHQPMNEAIGVLEEAGFSYRDIENYAILKHGLERNAWMREKAIADWKKDHPNAKKETFEKFVKDLPNDYAGIVPVEEEVGKPAAEFIREFEEKLIQEGEVRVSSKNEIEQINNRFNEELGLLTPENADSKVFNLGNPSGDVIASGLPNRPYRLYGNKLIKKAKEHGYKQADLKDLPKALFHPIAVFNGGEGVFNILTEININGKKALVGVQTNHDNEIDFNFISTVFDKSENGISNWINSGKLLYANKEKALNYLGGSAPISEAVNNKELNSAIKVIENFKNPKEKTGIKLVDEFWRKINDATQFSLQKELEGGFIDKKVYDELTGRWKYYIPLRGHDKKTAEDRWDYSPMSGTYFVNPLVRANGRTSRSESPFAYIYQSAHSAISAANKNLLNQTMLRLSWKDKSGLLTASKTWYVKSGFDKAGNQLYEAQEPKYSDNAETYRKEIEVFEARMKDLAEKGEAFQKGGKLDIGSMFIKERQKEQHAITVFQNGVEYQVYVNANPAVSRAVNGQNMAKSTDANMLSRAHRAMAANFTTRNPLFVMSNFARDYLFSSSILGVKEDAHYLGQYQKNLLKSAPALARYLRGKGNPANKMDGYMYEYIMNGAKTGFSHIVNLQRIQKQVERDIKHGDKKGMLRHVVEALGDVNDFAENLSRFSVYVTSREAGRSVVQSVSDAKNVTVNFNQSGTGKMGARYFKLAYLFTNAAVQALSNFIKVYKKNPGKATVMLLTYVANGAFLVPLINSLLGGDDEYWKLSDWDRQNNICIYTGNGFIKIPLPQELRVFFGFGDNIAQAILGKKDGGDAFLDAVGNLFDLAPMDPAGSVTAALSAYNDKGIEEVPKIISTKIAPDVLKPFVQYSVNRNFMGGQIYKEHQKSYRPGYTKVRTNKRGEAYVPDWLVDFAKATDHFTGGDGVEAGVISINPDFANHVVKGYTGGVYDAFAQSIDMIYKGLDGKNIEMRDTPIKRFFTSTADTDKINQGLNSKYYSITKKADTNLSKAMDYMKEVREGRMGVMEYNEKIKGLNVGVLDMISSYKKRIDRLNKMLSELEGDAQRGVEDQIISLKEAVIELND